MKLKLNHILCAFLLGIAGNIAADELVMERKSLNESSVRNSDTLVIALRNDLPPMSFLSVEGQPAGLFVDMWRLWAEKTGQKVEFHIAPFKDSLNAFKAGRADIHSALNYSEERSEWMAFSQPVYEFSLCFFFSKKHGKALDISQLNGQKIGVIGGTYLEEQLRKRYPDIEIVPFIAIEDMIHAARGGQIRSFLNTPASTSGMFTQLGLAGEFESLDESLFARKLHAGVLKNNKELLSLVDKGLDLISNEELAEIEKRWVPDPDKRYFKAPSNLIRLTAAEQAWLKAHMTVKISIPAVFPPLMFPGENKSIQGIVPDYLDFFSKRTGICFEPVYAPLSELPELIETRRTDMSPAFINLQPNRFVDLTHSCFALRWEIVNRIGAPFLGDVKALAGMKAVVDKDCPIYDQLKKDHPEIEIYPDYNSRDAMQSVSSGNTDAFIGTFVVAGYLMQKYQFPNLKVAGLAGCEDLLFRFAVRNDWPELVSILNKVIDSITPQEHNQIFNNWMPVRYEQTVKWQTVIKWVLWVGGILGMISGLMIFWNRKLAKEILQRKKVETALRDSEDRLCNIMNNSSTMIFLKDVGGRYLYVNRQYEKIFHVTNATIQGKTDQDIFSKETADAVIKNDQMIIQNGQSMEVEESVPHDDGIHTYISVKFPIRNISGEIYAVCAIATDITERKRVEGALRTLLAEKEVLLKEVHHRVKNNLAAIMGLLDLQGQTMDDEPARTALVELSARIRSMALVHEQLYQSDDFSRIDFHDYLEVLIAHLRSSYQNSGDIHVSVATKDVKMGLDNAVPCGLLITELVTNALKYAFPESRPPEAGGCEIAVSAEWDGAAYTLIVTDNGVGLPADLDWTNTKTLGLLLVKMLGQHQLQGQIELDRTGGTSFRLQFVPRNL